MAIYKNTPPIVTSGSVLNIDAANWAQPVSRNLLNYSTDLTNAAWTKTRCQITASSGIAPDGTNTAFAMTITDASSLVRLAVTSFTASVQGGPWTFSCYVSKSSNCNAGSIQLGIYDGQTAVQGVEPDYAIQANFIPSGSGGITTRRTTFEGNGWYRIATTVTLTSSIHTYYTFIDIENGFGGTKTNGDVVFLWKPQFEAGIEATAPNDIPTTVRFAPDLSGNGNTGSFSTNRPTRTPNNGGSIAFLGSYTGNPTLTYAATPTLNISGSSMSGEVWVKFNRLDYTTSSGSLMYFYYKGNPDSASPNNGIWFSYDNRNNGNSFPYTCFGNTAGGFVGGGNNFSGNDYAQTFATGSWNHIVFVINNSTGSFYINGLQKGPNKNFTNLNLYNTGSSTTGVTAFNVVPPAPTPFEIGVFRLYNRALSQQEVFQNYNALKSRFNLS
jgi:hypothetical protein